MFTFRCFLYRFAVVAFAIFITSCDSGCIDADDDGSVQTSLLTTIYPVNPDVISDVINSNVAFSSSNLGALSSQYLLKPGTTNATAMSNIWYSFTSKDRISGTSSDVMAYENMPVSISVDGNVLLNGAQDIVNLQAKFDQVGNSYFLPVVTSDLSLSGGSEISISVLETTNTPKIGGVELKQGLGVFAVIAQDPDGDAQYSQHQNWACHPGTGGSNTVKGGSLLSGCANLGSGANGIGETGLNISESSCNPSLLDGECQGFSYDSNPDSTNTNNLGASNFSTVGWMGEKDENIRTKYLFYSLNTSYRTMHMIANGMPSVANGSAKPRWEYRGMGYTGQTLRSGEGGNVPVNSSDGNSFRIHNPWVWNSDFAICTHDKTINGWATSRKFKTADMPHVGPISHWYFENTGTCDSIDLKYNISKVNAKYGGSVYYNIANTDIFWGGLNTDRITDCSYCETPDFNSVKPKFCNKLSCNFNINNTAKQITPTSCKAKDFVAQYPLQYVLFNTMVADSSNINKKAGNKDDHGMDNYKHEDVLQSASCNYNISINGNPTSIASKLTNTWTVVGGLINKGDSVSVDVGGAYTQPFSFGAARSYSWVLTCFYTLGTDEGFFPNQKHVYRDFGNKNCRASTVFAIKQIPFSSCFSGYNSGCSNIRNPSTDSSDPVGGCGGTLKYQDTNGISQVVSVGSCIKTVNGIEIPQKYSNLANQRINTLINSIGSFTTAENIRIDDCGVCVASGLPLKENTAIPIVRPQDFAATDSNSMIHAADCRANPNYQWVQSYVDAQDNSVSTYTTKINSVSSYCQDSHKTPIKSGFLRSLTALSYSNEYTNGVIYGEVGQFTEGIPTKISPNMIYTVPDSMDGASISFGIAGEGTDINSIYTASDKTNNTISDNNYTNFNILLQTGKVASNGKYLFFYIQPFQKDNNGNYKNDLDPNLSPNVVFANLTHAEIYKKGTANPTNPLLLNFFQENLSSGGIVSADGVADGYAQIVPYVSGKLWAAILDLPGSIQETYDVTRGKDRDGKAIIYRKNISGDPGISDDYTNIVAWNTGLYKVKVKAAKPVNQSSALGSQIVTGIANFIKSLFFGPIIQTNCKNVATSTPGVTNISSYNSIGNTDNTVYNSIQAIKSIADRQSCDQYIAQPIKLAQVIEYDPKQNKYGCYDINNGYKKIEQCAKLGTNGINFTCDSTKCNMTATTIDGNNININPTSTSTQGNCKTGEVDICSNVGQIWICAADNIKGAGYLKTNIDPLINSISNSTTKYTPKYCQPSGTMDTKELIPSGLKSLTTWPINTYYKCNTTIKKCQLYYTGSDGIEASLSNNSLPMLVLRYGDCSTSGSANGNSKMCNVYELNYQNSDIYSCLRTNYNDSSCWTKTTKTEQIPVPYDYIQNNDMLPGNIMPPCNNNKPYKNYTNCQFKNGKRFCDIERDCFPGGNITLSQTSIEVPTFVNTGDDPVNLSSSGDNIDSVYGCQSGTINNPQNMYCVADSSDSGYKSCDINSQNSAQCATCTRPTISGTLLTKNLLSSVGHNCSSNNDNFFYCDSDLYTACTNSGQNNRPDIKFLSSDTVQICNISSITPNLSYRVNQLYLSTNESLISCNATRSCNYYSYQPNQSDLPPVTNDTPIAQDSIIVEQRCDTTYDWKSGLIYQIVTLFTSSFSITVLFYIAVILYVMIRGLGILMGTESVSMQELSKQIISLGLALMFFSPTSWNNYQHFIIEFYVKFTEGLNTLIAGIVMPTDTMDGTNLFGPVDQVLNETFLNRTTWIKASAVIFSSWYGWIIFVVLVASMFLYIVTALKAIAMYLSTIIMSSVLFCVGPVFFLLLLFKETEQYFSTWKSQIIGMIASQAYLFSALAIFSSLYLGVVKGLLYYKVCFKAIFTLPVINVTLIGWWKVASNALPEAIAYQIGNTNGLLAAYDDNIPSPSKVILLLLIVALMEKFIQTPLVGGKSGMEIGDAIAPLLDQASGAVRGAAVSGIMAPVAIAEKAISTLPGGEALVNRLGISAQGSKLLSGENISTDEISRPSSNRPGFLTNFMRSLDEDQYKKPSNYSSTPNPYNIQNPINTNNPFNSQQNNPIQDQSTTRSSANQNINPDPNQPNSGQELNQNQTNQTSSNARQNTPQSNPDQNPSYKQQESTITNNDTNNRQTAQTSRVDGNLSQNRTAEEVIREGEFNSPRAQWYKTLNDPSSSAREKSIAKHNIDIANKDGLGDHYNKLVNDRDYYEQAGKSSQAPQTQSVSPENSSTNIGKQRVNLDINDRSSQAPQTQSVSPENSSTNIGKQRVNLDINDRSGQASQAQSVLPENQNDSGKQRTDIDRNDNSNTNNNSNES